jgi:FKBP-type peptidyl-prolyl cis-trans isomerase
VGAGSTVRVRTIISLNEGEILSKDHNKGDVAEFRVGDRQIIPGLERGVIGMKPRGKRQLRISPHLAYGEKGIPDKIPANAVLRIEVELLDCD